MKLGFYPDGRTASAMFDVRTVLPADAFDKP